jgi:hypothetical protein
MGTIPETHYYVDHLCVDVSGTSVLLLESGSYAKFEGGVTHLVLSPLPSSPVLLSAPFGIAVPVVWCTGAIRSKNRPRYKEMEPRPRP